MPLSGIRGESTTPVEVKNEEPLAVTIKADTTLGTLPTNTTEEQDRQAAGVRLAARTTAPTTTEEDDRKTAGQREINRIWEATQRQIALAVIVSALFVAICLGLFGRFLNRGQDNSLQLAANVFLFGVANLVTGFYFGRTNHQRSGGVGGDTAGTR